MKNQINIYIEEACKKGLVEGVYCGVSAAVSVMKNGVYHRGVFSGGMTRFDREKAAMVGAKTFFDLASLTKPLCTTLCALSLLSAKKIQLEESCESICNFEIASEKKRIKIINLLYHSSGLPSYKPYYQQFFPIYSKKNTSLLIRKIMDEPLEYPTGNICLYSDLGFILLGAILEQKMGITLDNMYRKMITEPLNISHDLCFLPLDNPSFIKAKIIAATEECSWRNKLLQGEVHDEHCWLTGGVTGHAGLFGNIGGVMTLCETILDIWKDRGSHQAFSNTLLQQALSKKHSYSDRVLGFDTPSPLGSSCGKYFSQRSIGHLGFSGTSFWIDPDRDIIMVLLTNRIHPSRENMKIRQFRPFFHDYLMERICPDLKEE